MGRLNKYDSDVKVEILQNNHPTAANTSPTTGYLNNTIYDNYGNEYYFDKIPSSPENDLNAYNVSTQHSPGAVTTKTQKDYICINEMVDESYMRPPLWEDITSSIQNIDPENAIMLGSIATQVKLESNDPDQFMEPLSSSPLLSPLEIKTELKSHQLHHSLPSALSAATMTHHQASHHQHNPHHDSNLNHQTHQTLHLNLMHPNNSCNSSINMNNDDNNNSHHHNTYNNMLCGSTSACNQYEQNHLDYSSNLNSFSGAADSNGNLIPMHHQQVHAHPSSMQQAQHHHPQTQHHMQHTNGNVSYYNWQNQTPQVIIFN